MDRRLRLPATRRLFILACAGFLLAAMGCAQAGVRAEGAAAPEAETFAIGSKAPEELRILLTNDDGYSSPGLKALRTALQGAGHSVTVVAPSGNRSGASSSITSRGSLELIEHEPGVYSVSGTPADSVRVALDVLFAGAPPDLVVSGANFGENIGPSVLVSGTIGAALTAMGEGIPAIAVSVGLNLREARAKPAPFPSTIAAFPGAAAFTVQLIRQLDITRAEGDPLLPPRTILNVNHPARRPSDLAGVAHVRVGRAAHLRFGYERGEGDTVVVVFAPDEAPETVENADTTRFREGFVTISTFDGDVVSQPLARRTIEARTRSLLGERAPSE